MYCTGQYNKIVDHAAVEILCWEAKCGSWRMSGTHLRSLKPRTSNNFPEIEI